MLKNLKKIKIEPDTRYYLILIAGVLIVLYVLFAFVVMPIYTRHWQRVQVPDVVNLSLTAAEKIVRHHHLEPVRTIGKYDDALPAGFVSFQSPSPEMSVKKGRRIYLTASKGKRPVAVPNLVGLNMRDAHFTIAQSQLEFGAISYEFDSYYPEDVVMTQAIPPETEIVAGSQIDITVSMGEETSIPRIPNLYGRPLDEAELRLRKARLVLGNVSYRESNDLAPDLVIYQSLEAGFSAVRGDTVHVVLSRLPAGSGEGLPW